MRAGLYVHFPFCRGKCPYCHFYSIPDHDDLRLAWREGLKREADLAGREKFEIDTVYIGGGTPSLLHPDEIHALRELLAGRFWLEAGEWTLEANPGVADAAVVRGWKQAGVTRLSIGVQSFDDGILRTLGRGYSADQARDFFRLARQAGFPSVGIDLMTGVPGQGPRSAEAAVAETARLGPDHVSLYILENVEGLPFEKVLRDRPVDDDAVADAYRTYQEGLGAAGFRQYEISNFARPGKECRHNLKYWRYEPFLGLGPSACSHIGGRRWSNKQTWEEWAGALRRGERPYGEVTELGPEAQAREALVFGLRLVEGVDLDILSRRFGVDIGETLAAEIAGLEADGWLVRDGRRIRIPPDRFILSNFVFSRLV